MAAAPPRVDRPRERPLERDAAPDRNDFELLACSSPLPKLRLVPVGGRFDGELNVSVFNPSTAADPTNACPVGGVGRALSRGLTTGHACAES